jgi:hypothetical protein
MFTEEGHTFLFCTVSRSDVNTLRKTITSEDANAFVVIGHGHQAIGGVISRANPENLAQDIVSQEEDNPPEPYSQAAK